MQDTSFKGYKGARVVVNRSGDSGSAVSRKIVVMCGVLTHISVNVCSAVAY